LKKGVRGILRGPSPVQHFVLATLSRKRERGIGKESSFGWERGIGKESFLDEG